MRVLRAASATRVIVTLLLPAQFLAVDLEKAQKITVSSASTDFAAAEKSVGYNAASKRYGESLRRDTGGGYRAPYIDWAGYSDGRMALTMMLVPTFLIGHTEVLQNTKLFLHALIPSRQIRAVHPHQG